jgi:DNA-binding winged helix-turn-helix (wHTH) protein
MDLAQEAAFRLGRLLVSPPTCEVAWGDCQRTLQPRVMQVLVALAQADGAVVSRQEELAAQCWGGRDRAGLAAAGPGARGRFALLAGDPALRLYRVP